MLPLLDALRAVVNLDNDDPDHVDYVDADRAEALLLARSAASTPATCARLARPLRTREKAAGHRRGAGRRALAASCCARRCVDDGFLDGLDGPDGRPGRAPWPRCCATRARSSPTAAPPRRCSGRCGRGTGWPRRLRRSVELGGGAARRAHRDLDAICALFDVAARAEEQRGHTGVASFLATLRAQQIPADTLAERGVRGDAVRLLTAHRSKGLEWRLVVVAHVQEDGWPDLRRRSTLLQADRIGADGPACRRSPTRELLAEERRLFYVACTRARAAAGRHRRRLARGRRRAAVPVRRRARRHRRGTGRRAGRRAAAVAGRAGRRAAPHRSPTPTSPSRCARPRPRRLARLARRDRRRPRRWCPPPTPATWWGTRAAHAVRRSRCAPPDEPVAGLGQRARVAADLPGPVVPGARGRRRAAAPTSRQGFGKVVHALAERIAAGELAADPDDVDR